ncbi:hypothetical protein ACSVIJ_21640 [Pseudomonas sp. NCHU5208]|uniref:hypothetical protein n=1 Tax=unclassified Pseudomonas TaxID=196821 RepID=UPI003F9496DE
MRPVICALLGLLCMTTQASENLPPTPPPDPVADAPARLIVSRDEQAPNACDVELYVNQQVVATLGPGQRTSLDLPSGEQSLAVAISPEGYCGGTGPQTTQSILLTPGETRQFDVKVEPDQVFLAPRLE